MTVAPVSGRRIRVPVKDLGLAPENLRFEAPADDGVARLADTIRAAGLIYPPLVRAARKGEDGIFLVLDGRRRLLALQRLVAEGHTAETDEVDCILVEGRAAQTAAAVVANSEHAPVHLADVIVAIGKLRQARLTTGAIAAALGYDELEIRRLEALSAVHATVLLAFRQGRLTLRQVRLFARLKDASRQEELARTALDGYVHDYQLQSLVHGGRITAADERVTLVGLDAYRAAGGRVESDLFGELPDVLLDAALLTRLWRSRLETVTAALAAEGLTVYLGEDRGYRAPDGLHSLPFVHVGSLPEAARTAFDAARAEAEAAAAALEALEPGASDDGQIIAWLRAQLSLARVKAQAGAVEAVLLSPGAIGGVDASFYWRPAALAADPGDAEQADTERQGEAPGRSQAEPPEVAIPQTPVSVEGIGHALHEVRTDLATRGLIRALADHPTAALVALTAQLFQQLALHGGRPRSEHALAVTAQGYSWPGRPAVAALDGDVRRRLAERRLAYKGSGLRPIPWVESLAPEDRLALLAELTALSLDLREARTTALRRPARAEALEIAALCAADVTGHWTPDETFLRAHTKPQLLAMLEAMGVGDSRTGALKKDELVALVAEAAAERRWAPSTINWRAATQTPTEPAGGEGDSLDARAADETDGAVPGSGEGGDAARGSAQAA